MKRIIIAMAAILACSSITMDAAVQAKKIIKQMKKSAGVTITYGLADREESRFGTRIEVCGDKQRSVSMRPEAMQDFYPKETTYVDYGKNIYYQSALLSAEERVSSKREFVVNKGFTVVGDTTLLGFKCKIARIMINSNTMEVWYTTELGIQATPTPGWGVTDGVVLRYSRNGQHVIDRKSVV